MFYCWLACFVFFTLNLPHMQLRPYQIAAVNETRIALQSFRRVLACMPTGAGKTVFFSHILATAIKRGYRAGVAVHRAELIAQTREKLIQSGVPRAAIGVVQGSQYHYRDAPVLIASVQTLKNRDAYFDSSQTPAIWIVDECHRQEFDDLFSRPEFVGALVIGVTATPHRSGKMRQLGAIYETLIEPVTIKSLVYDGYLSKPTYLLPGQVVNASGFQLDAKTGDYKAADNFAAFNKTEIYDGLIDGYREAGGGKALIFCANIEHSKLTAAQFQRAGYVGTWIDGGMSKTAREKIIADYRSSRIEVLTNCDILTTGFDDPSIRVIGLNRATASLALYLQMCGRGARTDSGKTEFFIVDAGTNQKRLGPWEADRPYSLWHKTPLKKGVAPMKDCPSCKRIVPAPATRCQYCGHVFEVTESEVKIAEGWTRFSFDEMLSIQASAARSKVGRASLLDLIKLKESKVVAKPYALYIRASKSGIDLFEAADALGFDRGSVSRFLAWAKEKDIALTAPVSAQGVDVQANMVNE